MAHGDPDEKTFLYILYLEHLELDGEAAADYVGAEAAIFWYVGDGEQYHSSEPMVLSKDQVRCAYCSFYSITMPNLPDRSLSVTMTLSVNDEHIGVAFLDFKDFGESHVFKESQVKLLTDAGVLAVATLHTASQARWSYSAPIEPNTTGFFVDYTSDDQAKQLHDHIFPKADDGAEEQQKAEEAEKARQEEEARKKREAEQRHAEQRREDERREAERKREQEDREAARRQEDDRRREEEQRQRAQEDERRRAEDQRRDREQSERSDQERQRRWEEEEEAERRRRDEFERRKRDYLEKGEPLSAPTSDHRRKERQQWEEDRERLKRDARRLRERELADLEQRAEDRRRQIEALTNSRLASNVPSREPQRERARPQLAAARETAKTSHRKGVSSQSKTASEGRRPERGGYTLSHTADEDSASEELTFDGEEEEESPQKGGAAHPTGVGAGNFQWPRSQGASATRRPAPQRQGHVVLRGGAMQVHGSPAELSLAERLEHFRSQAALNRLGANQREMVVESSGPVPMLETIEISEPGQVDGGVDRGAARVTTPRKKFGMRKADEGRKANAVLNAVLQDAAGNGFGLSGSVAQMEEAVLRLLVLHKELAAQDEAPQAALADATAGLAPRMLQVLQAAKAVCEANRQKLKVYTEEKQLGIDRTDYLVPQMRAIDRLQQQFNSLIPGHADVLEEKCQCGAEFSSDAKFCRLCGRRRQERQGAGGAGGLTPRQTTAPSSARFSPRTEAPPFGAMGPPLSGSQLQHLQAPSLSSSPPSARRQNMGYMPRNEAPRPDRPIDPGLPDSQLPALRGGSPVKPRRSLDGAGFTATPRSEVSSVAAPWSGPEYRVRRVNVPAIPHWERQHLAKAVEGRTHADAERHTAAMWDAVAAATVKSSPRPAEPVIAEPIATEVSPLWDAVAGVACGSRSLRSPRMPSASTAPLRSAVQQVRGVANELSRRGRGSGGGAHAGAGSPSPRQEPSGGSDKPPEDKYLKILQSLQAKGAMNGSGLAAQLLEKQGLRRRASHRGMQDADTDSESSDLR